MSRLLRCFLVPTALAIAVPGLAWHPSLSVLFQVLRSYVRISRKRRVGNLVGADGNPLASVPPGHVQLLVDKRSGRWNTLATEHESTAESSRNHKIGAAAVVGDFPPGEPPPLVSRAFHLSPA